MIGLTFTVENIDVVWQVYDQIEIIRYDQISINPPDTPIGQPAMLVDWAVVSGTVDFPAPIDLAPGVTFYQTYDPVGEAENWYSSRYYDSSTGSYSAWGEPILGGEGDLFHDPIYPSELTLTVEEQAIVNRLRIYIGDPKGLRRDSGETALTNIHPDGKTYELEETGWPVYVTVGGQGFTDLFNPSVNGYRYLKFQELIDQICVGCYVVETVCDEEITKMVELGVDIWYYTFRHSDRQLLAAYDSCPPPMGLTTDTATTQVFMLQTAIDLITKELLEDAVEDGAKIDDEGSKYDPTPGLKIRQDLLADLRKRLDDLIKRLLFSGVTGVLVD